MKPSFFLAGAVGLIIVAAFIFLGLHFFKSDFKPGTPIEPPNDLADVYVWFSEAEIFDLSVDDNGEHIIFATDAQKVNLLDRDRRLLWARDFSTAPLQARLSGCGGYLAVGTAGGKLFFMSTDQSQWWEVFGEGSVYRVLISPTGKWVVIGRGDDLTGVHALELYDQNGDLHWSIETGELDQVILSGEHVQDGRIFYTEIDGDSKSTYALTLEGNLIWAEKDTAISAVAHSRNRLALIRGGALHITTFMGHLLWDKQLAFRVERAIFNPDNHGLLVYGRGDGNYNLFYYSPEGAKLWESRIADGSLLAFTSDGQHIVTSSWRHYRDDYSLMVLLDEGGREIEHWKVAMRVEFLRAFGAKQKIVLGGEDGYIQVIDLDTRMEPGQDRVMTAFPLYNPVSIPESDDTLVTLYFCGDGEELIPVTRRISQTENRLRASIEELIRGPSRDSFLFRTFPKNSEVGTRINEETGELYLNLSPEIAGMAGSAQSTAALDSLLLTLGGFAQVKDIYLTQGEHLLEVFGDGLAVDQPLTALSWQQPVFVPVRSGGRYYLLPRETGSTDFADAALPQEGVSVEREKATVEELLHETLRASRDFYFVPRRLSLEEVEIKNNTVFIVLSEEFKGLFPEEYQESSAMQAALLMDALFLTAHVNSGMNRVEIKVKGEEWSPPQNYPALRRVFRGFNINPEF